MKKLVLISTIFLMTASTSFAFDFLGPPTNPWQQGQWGAGFGYCYSNMNVNVKGHRYFSHAGISGRLPHKLRIHKYYGTVGYGLTNDIGVYGLAGAAHASSDIKLSGTPQGHVKMDFGYAPIYGFGVKSTLYRNHKVQVGAMVQCSWVCDLSVRKHIYSFEYAKGNIDLMEMHIAAGPTYQLCSTTMIYGGPLLHFVRGDFRSKGYCNICRSFHASTTHDIQQESWFGGIIGLQTKINNCISLLIEYIYTAQVDALGTGFFIPL